MVDAKGDSNEETFFKAFGRGILNSYSPTIQKLLAFIRQYKDESILTVINLSRFSQVAELDLSRFSGYVPEEIFSETNSRE